MSIKNQLSQQIINPLEAIQMILDTLELDSQSKITPPFPQNWPPQNDPTVIYFVYRQGSPAKTGRIMYKIASPHVKITLYIKKHKDKNLIIKQLEPSPLSVLEPVQLEQPDTLQQEQAASILFSVLIESSFPSKEESRKIRAFYQKWIINHSALHKYLENQFSSFFAWIFSE